MKLPKILSTVLSIVFIWSAIDPKFYFTWALEVFPAVLGFIILIGTYHRFRFTNLVYIFIFVSISLMLVGGHYTYSEVPFFNWIKEILNHSRNNYDKLGHLAQGFLPALITREFLIRKNIISHRGWMNFFVLSFCMASSVVYEFFEWAVALIAGGTAEAFLGTQGYAWDVQSDLFSATIGAVLALLVFSKIHDRAIVKLQEKQ